MKFLLVPEEKCVYLPDLKAANLFLQPDIPVNTEIYHNLLKVGFRRSGDFIYRPYCNNCRACISVRIPVAEFKPNRSQKRVLAANTEITVDEKPADLTDEQFALYENYINERHVGSSMSEPDPIKTEDFFTSFWCDTRFFEFRLKGKLVMVAVVDQFKDSLSAVYTYFDPTLKKQSLGVYGVLWEIEYCKSVGFDYLHLGFWVDNCQKMSYKVNYRPVDLLVGDDSWLRLNKGETFDKSQLLDTEFDKQLSVTKIE
ncbi:MAG: arginyltransferase [Methylococcales bacterium]|jgi:leucyl-tRNA---protein transferase|nr:arginyltransferase [Methylococcales bacterium]MBT7442625.1 arginyltransferase [Methylococcales bacterium]